MPKTRYSYEVIPVGSDGILETRDVLQQEGYFLNDSQLQSPFGHHLPSAVADLLDIAAAIMLRDRQSIRSTTQKGTRRSIGSRGWAREIYLPIEVREPSLWERTDVKTALEQLLGWLTEDDWHLAFLQQVEARRFSDLQAPLFSSPPNNALVVLYSGGLDSLAGLIRLLQTHPDQPVILVSALHPRLQGVIQTQVDQLQLAYGSHVVQQSRVPFHRNHSLSLHEPGGVSRHREEPTQRTRGFLFLAFGVAAAVAAGASRILTCENGVGALNLPLNWRQLGTQHTRAMHPRTLLEMTRLLALLGLPHLRCEAPHLLRTKGELCADLHNSGHGALCKLTSSCDSFPLHSSAPTPGTQVHCGWCTSCLLRRQAIYAGNLVANDQPVHYQVDVCRSLKATERSFLGPLKMMLDQVTIIRHAQTSEQPIEAMLLHFPELVTASRAIEAFPDGFQVAPEVRATEALCSLFFRYAAEWDRFPYHL